MAGTRPPTEFAWVGRFAGTGSLGQLFAIECKAPGNIGRTSADQAAFLDAVEKRSAVAIIADRLEDVISAIMLHQPGPQTDGVKNTPRPPVPF